MIDGMLSELDILREISLSLETAGIDYMLTGSMAMNYYAQPRMTRDLDLVIRLAEQNVDDLMKIFEKDFYIDLLTVKRAVKTGHMFNVIHFDSVIKIDFIVLKDDSYRQEEFERRKRITIGEFQTWIVSLEDLVISKLFWARESRSELQFRDVRNLLTVPHDREYVQRKAGQLQIEGLLEEVLNED